jgi:hypothetical protein
MRRILRDLNMVLFLALLLATPVWASTMIFNSFGPDDSFTSSVAYLLDAGIAVPSGSINGRFHSVRLVGQHYVGPNEFQLVLATNNNGLPGSPLETIDFSFPSTVGNPDDEPVPFTILSVTEPQMMQGSIYWVIVQARNPDVSSAVWYPGLVPLSFLFRNVNTNFQWQVNELVGPGPSLQIFVTPDTDGPPIPEPSTVGMMGVALIAVAVSRRFRRKAGLGC